MNKGKKIDTFNSLKDVGNQHFKAKQYDKAKEIYTKAIKSSEDLAVVYSNRAQCNLNLSLYYDALNDSNAAIRIDPEMTKAYYRRARALQELSRYRLASADYQKVLQDDPTNELAQKELDKVRVLLDSDERVDLKIYPKPEEYRSNKPLQTFENRPSNYFGSCRY